MSFIDTVEPDRKRFKSTDADSIERHSAEDAKSFTRLDDLFASFCEITLNLIMVDDDLIRDISEHWEMTLRAFEAGTDSNVNASCRTTTPIFDDETFAEFCVHELNAMDDDMERISVLCGLGGHALAVCRAAASASEFCASLLDIFESARTNARGTI